MTQPLDCDSVVEHQFVERYLARTLAEPEAAAFEAHYLTCATCQSLLRFGVGLRRALSQTRAPASRRWLWLAAPVGLAAALAGVLLLRSGTRDDPRLAALGAVAQAPIYLGLPVRADLPATADSLFGAAMQAYFAERYRDAAAGLRTSLDAGVDPAPAEFFLGASLLLIDRREEAAAAFGRVIALGEGTYLAEARYYRAKALLQLGRGSEALAEVNQVPDGDSVIGQTARALADSIREVLRR